MRLVALAAGLAGAAGSAVDANVTLDRAAASWTFDGVGALSAGASSRLLVDYAEPYRSQVRH
jgi:galactosylceramidase